MAKIKVQEATKELSLNAGRLMEEAMRVSRSATETLSKLKRIEQSFVQQEEERREAERLEQQRQALEQQSTAWVMPEEPEAQAEPEPSPASLPQDAPVKVPQEAPVSEAKQEEQPEKAVAQASKPETASAAPRGEGTRAQGAPQQPRPAGQQRQQPAQQGPYGRPAPGNPQYGKPAAQQGPYGRPAPGNPQYGRPAGQQGGQYGRPAPGNPQYGRPAGQQGGQYGRPAPGNPQYGRPAGQQGGQFGRPAGGQGAARPGGGYGGAPGGQRPGKARGPELLPVVEKERVSNYDPNKKMYQRQHDNERGRPRRGGVRELGVRPDDDVFRGGKKRRRQPSVQQSMAPIKIETAYMTAETITVKDLTERIGKPAGEIIKKLLLLGIMATINQELDFETAALVSAEFDVELVQKLEKTAEDMLVEVDSAEDDDADLATRPPVVTIMGHVDHGKTSLLDYIRNSRVTEGEAGGITQHIGAYMVEVDGRKITFLDTPGHEAFTAMRARGAQATDIAILVVAADDGVMPQTIEAINHAKAANVPIIIAINKMDKDAANPSRVMQDLTNYELVAEEWGGDTIMAQVSAITGEGIEQLLETILLVADMQELKANPARRAHGIIIEAKLDKGRGPVATVLVQNGTLHVGDTVVAGMAYGRIRAMVNERGERVTEALPSTPVEVIGFSDVPNAGDEMSAVDERLSRQVVEERRDKQKAALAKASAKVSLDDLFTRISEGEIKDLNIIVKADVQGSVEAVKQSLERLSNEEVRVRIIHGGVGAITENDVMLASTSGSIIIGFNVRPESNARDMAVREEVDVRLYRIIYQAIEDVEKAMKGLLAPQFREVILGHAEVRSVFKVTGSGTIAGCYVTDGKVQRNAEVRLLRDNVVIYEGKLDSLRRFKDDVREVASGYECGIGLERYNDIKEGDVIECFINEEVER